MNDNPEWFAPKRYGYGAGMPISWQGWAITVLFLVIAIGAATLFARKPLPLFAVMLPAILIFTIVCAKTTRGGWRWRWGDPD